MKHALYLKTNISLHENNLDNENDKYNFDYAVAFIQVIESAIRCIPCENIEKFAVVDHQVASKTYLGWENFIGVSGLIDILEDCLKRWIVEISRNTLACSKYYHASLLAACFQMFSTFYQRYSMSSLCKTSEFLKTIEHLVSHINTYMFKSNFFETLLSRTSKLSMFYDLNGKDGRLRDPENLPSLGVTR